MAPEELVGKVCLHVPTGTVGRLVRWWAAAQNGDPPSTKVEVEPGHTFHWSERAFIPLGLAEEELWRLCQDVVGQVARDLGTMAGARRMPVRAFVLLFGAVLRAQLDELQRRTA